MATKAFLKNLRRKHGLGEFAKNAKRRRKRSVPRGTKRRRSNRRKKLSAFGL